MANGIMLQGTAKRLLWILFLRLPTNLLVVGGTAESCRSDEICHADNEHKKNFHHILAAEPCEAMAHQLVDTYPHQFTFHPTKWNKFPDGTDHIEIGGFDPHNMLQGQDVLFLASFHDNDVSHSQFQVFIHLLQTSFLKSLTVVLPFYPVGTMERVEKEGIVPTAVTYAHMFSTLPSVGKTTRLVMYDLHTLHNRFYFHGNVIASLKTAMPLFQLEMNTLQQQGHDVIDAIAFPDDGAAKRFGPIFFNTNTTLLELVVCRKTRQQIEDGSRRVEIQNGNVTGRRHVVIVDDLIQTGGTLYECCKALKSGGARSVSAFITHAVFPNQSWKRFAQGGDWSDCLDTFWTTNSVPTTTMQLPKEDVFQVLDMTDLIVKDLDRY